jgi:hypothetical protein
LNFVIGVNVEASNRKIKWFCTSSADALTKWLSRCYTFFFLIDRQYWYVQWNSFKIASSSTLIKRLTWRIFRYNRFFLAKKFHLFRNSPIPFSIDRLHAMYRTSIPTCTVCCYTHTYIHTYIRVDVFWIPGITRLVLFCLLINLLNRDKRYFATDTTF